LTAVSYFNDVQSIILNAINNKKYKNMNMILNKSLVYRLIVYWIELSYDVF